MSKPGVLIALAALLFVIPAVAYADDPPHDISGGGVNCTDCHALHNAPGPSLTSYASISNLCASCHNPGGSASAKPFYDAMQATPGSSGNSHRWDVAIDPATCFPNNCGPNSTYGVRKPAADRDNPQADEIQSYRLNVRLEKFGNVVTCAVCHFQHSQERAPWDPFAPAYGGAGTGDGRHFMQVDNDLNQLCEDCHYYRSVASGQTDVRTYDGNKKSHPLVKNLTTDVTDSTQFVGAAPLETNFNAQTTSPRYHQNGTGDTNLTNNLVLDSSSKVRCLSCHGVHYTDSDSTTVDGP